MVQILSTRGRAPKELLGVGAELGGVATRNRIAPETVTVLAPALGDTELYQHGAEATDVGLPTFTHDTSSHRYARIEVRVTEAGASGAVLQLQYRRRSVGGDFLPAGGPLGAVEASLAAVGDVIGGSVPLTAQCTGDCEFRVVAAGGDGAASPCIENLYVKFMDIPLPASTPIPEPPDPDPDGCNSGLTGTALFGEDFCGFESKAEVIAFYGQEAFHHTHPAVGPFLAGLTWSDEYDDPAPWEIVTDHPWNGGHHARRLVVPTASEGTVFLHGLAVEYDSTPVEERLTGVWVRVRFTVPPDYTDAASALVGSNHLSVCRIYGPGGVGAVNFMISRYWQTELSGPGPLQLIAHGWNGSSWNVNHMLGSLSDLFSAGGVHEVVVNMARDGSQDYHCRAWLDVAGGSSHTKIADFTATQAFATPWVLRGVETMFAYWGTLPDNEPVIEHLESEVATGVDPFGVGG